MCNWGPNGDLVALHILGAMTKRNMRTPITAITI
jgi:hypothetical protein